MGSKKERSMDLLQQIYNIGIIPVIKIEKPEEDAYDLAKALCDGGVPVAEVTFRTEGAARGIQIMREGFPDMLVGAGTIFTTDQAKQAISAGAKFIVSPGFDQEVVAYCKGQGIPIFPGCITPTEIQMAIKEGLSIIKFYPAEQSGGLNTIKALSAPFGSVKFMPTGGISLENLGAYLAHRAIIACGGSYMVTDELILNKKWDEITHLCEKSVEVVNEIRNLKM